MRASADVFERSPTHVAMTERATNAQNMASKLSTIFITVFWQRCLSRLVVECSTRRRAQFKAQMELVWRRISRQNSRTKTNEQLLTCGVNRSKGPQTSAKHQMLLQPLKLTLKRWMSIKSSAEKDTNSCWTRRVSSVISRLAFWSQNLSKNSTSRLRAREKLY